MGETSNIDQKIYNSCDIFCLLCSILFEIVFRKKNRVLFSFLITLHVYCIFSEVYGFNQEKFNFTQTLANENP